MAAESVTRLRIEISRPRTFDQLDAKGLEFLGTGVGWVTGDSSDFVGARCAIARWLQKSVDDWGALRAGGSDNNDDLGSRHGEVD